MAFYIYGLMRARDADAAVSAAVTAGGPELEALEHGGLAALVTSASDGAVRLRREALVGHADVLQAAFDHGPVLPLRFGTVMPDQEAVSGALLAPRAPQLLARLDWLEQRAELRVKAGYLEEPLLRSILERDPALARAAHRMRQLPAAATHFERIRIGEAIAAAVETRRAVDAEAMLGVLAPLCVAVSTSEPQDERAVLNAAFLVDRSDLGQFDDAVEELSRLHGNRMQLKQIGPMPAYSFADREWETESTKGAAGTWA